MRYPARIWYEDLCTSVKLLALAKSAAFVPDILYYYVDRTNSITRNTNTARNAELFTAFDNLLDWYRENGLFERYYNVLSRLAVDHVLLAALVMTPPSTVRSVILPKLFQVLPLKAYMEWLMLS